MRYIEGIDYWVRYVPFPNMASESVAASHGDGTFTIYINTRFPAERQRKRLMHEIKHLENEHFYRDDLSIRQIERRADGLYSDTRTLPGAEPRFTVFRSRNLPAGAVFGFYIPDQSMQPVFEEGESIYCDDQPIGPGDIGLFQYKGNTVCRQYHRDSLGITYLFTLNRKRQYEDIVLPSNERNELVCLGRVRTNQRIPLPE